MIPNFNVWEQIRVVSDRLICREVFMRVLLCCYAAQGVPTSLYIVCYFVGAQSNRIPFSCFLHT